MLDLRECLDFAGLKDLTIRGKLFTWSNKRVEDPIVKKLDRVLVNDLWSQEFPLSYAYYGEPGISDHSPSTIVVGSNSRDKKLFKVFHFLMPHEEFIPRVRKFWQNSVITGTSMF